jgi:2-polyprenyl-6-methoxyphenol hydroxylase-like FAD-dependent oxidoreductase
MVVIGDAAHAATPNAGQGASMAIEDGITLAKCLRDLPDTTQAFAAYEALRRERVERLVAASAELAAAVVARTRPQPQPTDWLYENPIDWDTSTTPPPVQQRHSGS